MERRSSVMNTQHRQLILCFFSTCVCTSLHIFVIIVIDEGAWAYAGMMRTLIGSVVDYKTDHKQLKINVPFK